MIGPIKKGAFHRWLGKASSAPISSSDVQRGLKAGGHAAKMANFARNAKHFKKPLRQRAQSALYGK